jgi:hypothetical protein
MELFPNGSHDIVGLGIVVGVDEINLDLLG